MHLLRKQIRQYMSSVIIINGSPRKDGNTAKMCRAFAEGVKSQLQDATVETVNLYDFDFKGCRSCFACKLKGSKSYGHCSVRDPIMPVLEKAAQADILVLGSPIFLMDVSAQMKAFLERLIFPFATYEAGYKTIAPKRCHVATVYTMNVPKEMFPEAVIANVESFIGHVFNRPNRICAFDTYQFSDYSRYAVEVFDEESKRKYRNQVFPIELKSAFNLGVKMAEDME